MSEPENRNKKPSKKKLILIICGILVTVICVISAVKLVSDHYKPYMITNAPDKVKNYSGEGKEIEHKKYNLILTTWSAFSDNEDAFIDVGMCEDYTYSQLGFGTVAYANCDLNGCPIFMVYECDNNRTMTEDGSYNADGLPGIKKDSKVMISGLQGSVLEKRFGKADMASMDMNLLRYEDLDPKLYHHEIINIDFSEAEVESTGTICFVFGWYSAGSKNSISGDRLILKYYVGEDGVGLDLDDNDGATAEDNYKKADRYISKHNTSALYDENDYVYPEAVSTGNDLEYPDIVTHTVKYNGLQYHFVNSNHPHYGPPDNKIKQGSIAYVDTGEELPQKDLQTNSKMIDGFTLYADGNYIDRIYVSDGTNTYTMISWERPPFGIHYDGNVFVHYDKFNAIYPEKSVGDVDESYHPENYESLGTCFQRAWYYYLEYDLWTNAYVLDGKDVVYERDSDRLYVVYPEFYDGMPKFELYLRTEYSY